MENEPACKSYPFLFLDIQLSLPFLFFPNRFKFCPLNSHLLVAKCLAVEEEGEENDDHIDNSQRQLLAGVVKDVAMERIKSISFKQVSLVDRVFLTIGCILMADSWIRKAQCSRVDDNPSSSLLQHRLDMHCNALWELDTSLLMAGCPLYASFVHDDIALIQVEINLLRDQLETVPPTPLLPLLDDHLILASLSSSTPTIQYPIRKESAPSLYSFTRLSSHPLHITDGVIDHWPALERWKNLNELVSRVGSDRTVAVEIGSKYTDESWTQKWVSFGEFVSRLFSSPSSSETYYLAQCDLFSQIPVMRNDVSIPDYCYASKHGEEEQEEEEDGEEGRQEVLLNCWIGPAGTISPAHTDPHDNIFAQVVGYKYIRLYLANQTHLLYPYPPDSLLHNTSQVDIESPDLIKFPLFAKAEYTECIIGPGELLYIPNGVWHYVRSLTPSFSVSFWY